MDDDIKVYRPEEITDQPFPTEGDVSDYGTSQETSKDTYGAVKIQDQPLPKKFTARELISSSLNTLSKKILGIYEFTKLGAIKIGEFILGQSGEIKISPDGIVATNRDGDTTFALDGTTGDATFKGTVEAGSVLTGGVTVEDENGQAIIDGTGLISTTNFNYGSLSVTSQPIFTPGDNAFHDLTGLSQTFNLARDVRVLFLMSVRGLPDAGSVTVRMNITGIDLTGIPYVEISVDDYVQTNHAVYLVPKGGIVYKLEYRCNAPATQFQLDPSSSTFVCLGT